MTEHVQFGDLQAGDEVRYGPFVATVEHVDPNGEYLLLDNGAELSPGAIQFDYMEKLHV